MAELGAERLLDIELCDDAVEMPEEDDDDDESIDSDEEDRRDEERKQLKAQMQEKQRSEVASKWLEKVWVSVSPALSAASS